MNDTMARLYTSVSSQIRRNNTLLKKNLAKDLSKVKEDLLARFGDDGNGNLDLTGEICYAIEEESNRRKASRSYENDCADALLKYANGVVFHLVAFDDVWRDDRFVGIRDVNGEPMAVFEAGRTSRDVGGREFAVSPSHAWFSFHVAA